MPSPVRSFSSGIATSAPFPIRLKEPNPVDAAGAVLGCLLSWIFLAVTFWPGLQDGDSMALLWFAREGWFTTYQSPLLGVIWRGLDAIGGVGGIFLFQTAFVSVSVTATLGLFLRGRWLLLAAPAVVFFPAVGPYAGTLVKDVWLGCAVMVGYVGYLRWRRHGGWAWLGLAALGIALAVQFRSNGVFAFAPMGLELAWRAWKGLHERRLGPALPALTAGIAVLFGVSLCVPCLRLFYRIDNQPAQQVIYLSDLAALTLETGEWLIPEEANPDGIDEARLRKIFNPRYCTQLVTYQAWQKDRLLLAKDPDIITAYRRAWLEAARKHPGAFLRRHLDVLTYFLGLDGVHAWFYQKESGHMRGDPEFVRAGWSAVYLGWVDALEETPANTLWAYLAAAAVVALAGRLLRRQRAGTSEVFLLAGSAWSYGIAFGLITYHVGFRYHWLPATLAVILAIDLLASIGQGVERFRRPATAEK